MPRKALRISWRDGNQIALLHDGVEFFPALCQAIDQARRVIHIETYIFRMDGTGMRILEHLRGACARGVKVRVLIDGFGSAEDAHHISRVLERMGDRKRTRLNSSHSCASRMPSSA